MGELKRKEKRRLEKKRNFDLDAYFILLHKTIMIRFSYSDGQNEKSFEMDIPLLNSCTTNKSVK